MSTKRKYFQGEYFLFEIFPVIKADQTAGKCINKPLFDLIFPTVDHHAIRNTAIQIRIKNTCFGILKNDLDFLNIRTLTARKIFILFMLVQYHFPLVILNHILKLSQLTVKHHFQQFRKVIY